MYCNVKGLADALHRMNFRVSLMGSLVIVTVLNVLVGRARDPPVTLLPQ